jgi:hypothetical protein
MKKVGFVVTTHYSEEYRPQGNEFIGRFCKSLNDFCKFDFNLYVVDNASVLDLVLPDNAIVLQVNDQTINGITGAWNLGIHKAYEDGCDIIINCNDDLWFNNTINKFISFIYNNMSEDVIYSALTNGVLGGSQKSLKPKFGKQIKECKDAETCINGFFFAMTNRHYEKYQFTKDKYFNKDNKFNGGDGKWGGQEGQFIENSEKGLFGIVVNECFVPHTKLRGWTYLKGK